MSGDATRIGGSATAFGRLDSAETCTHAYFMFARKIKIEATTQLRRLF
jgi:hypothetical protein